MPLSLCTVTSCTRKASILSNLMVKHLDLRSNYVRACVSNVCADDRNPGAMEAMLRTRLI